MSYIHCTTEYTTVQVLGSALYLDTEVTDTSQSVRDARFGLAQPVVIRDAHIVHVRQELVFLREQQIIQPFTAALLHTLEAEFEVHWDLFT